jgi:hypothetical protein
MQTTTLADFPVEVLEAICAEACIDDGGGRIVYSLRLTARFLHDAVAPYRFQYLAASGANSLERLVTALQTFSPLELGNIHHVFLSDRIRKQASSAFTPLKDRDYRTATNWDVAVTQNWKDEWTRNCTSIRKILALCSSSVQTLTLLIFNPTVLRHIELQVQPDTTFPFILSGMLFPHLQYLEMVWTQSVSKHLRTNWVPALKTLRLHHR